MATQKRCPRGHCQKTPAGLSSPEGLSLSAAELTAHHSSCPLSTRAIIEPPEGHLNKDER